MIIYTSKSAFLEIPKGLGNFATGGGSSADLGPLSGSVIELSATTENLSGSVETLAEELGAVSGETAAIGDVVADLIMDVDSLDESVSGNSADIEALSGATVANDQNIANLSGATENIQSNVNDLSGATQNIQSNVEALSGVTGDIAALSGETSANTVSIEALSGATSALTEDVQALSARTATSTTLGNIKVGSGLTIDSGGTLAAKNYYINLYDYINDVNNRRTKWLEFKEKYEEGYNLYVLSTDSSVNNSEVILPLVKYVPDNYLNFTTKDTSQNHFLDVILYSNGNLNGVNEFSKKINRKDIYTLPTASTSTKGGIKVGSGLTISSEKLSVDIGEGLAYSGNTIVVSGGTGGGGIEKVQSLPQNPEEGTIVLLEIPEFTVTTVSTNMDERDWEAGMTVAAVGNDGVDYQGYGQNFAKWNVINSTLSCRFRKDDNNNLLTDITADAADVTISEGESMTENTVPSYYELWEFKEGMWRQIDREWRFEIGKDGTIGDLYYRIYSGITNANPDNLVIRYEGRDYKPMAVRYYGMDCNTTDGRGSSPDDPGRINIVSRRLGPDSFGEFAGSETTATVGDINGVRVWIGQSAFGNGDRGGLTYDADNDRFVYDSQNWATGDTSNVLQDLIDYNFLINGLLTRDGRYGNFYCENIHTFYVISGGTTTSYTTPIIAKKDITNYTVGDHTFKWELTFNYGDWKLKVDVPESNAGINLRIAAV